MPYYKVTLDDTIIDVLTELDRCKYSPRSRMVLRCGADDDPEGIISTRAGLYYHVDGWAEFPETVTGSGGTVTLEEIDEVSYLALDQVLDSEGSVSEGSAEDIISADSDLEIVMERMIERMSAACNAAITAGVDVTLSDGQAYHFSLRLEDQLNLLSLQGMLAAGAEAVPYHADGEGCRYYSAEDFNAIAQAATFWKLYQESYFNSLRGYIQSMETMTEMLAVTYGMAIPEAYQTDVLKGLMVQMGSD